MSQDLFSLNKPKQDKRDFLHISYVKPLGQSCMLKDPSVSHFKTSSERSKIGGGGCGCGLFNAAGEQGGVPAFLL